MAWTNYRLVADRFSHIDAEFVTATSALSPQGSHVEVVVRFYPWWEHPLYVAARDRGDTWGFSSSCESGKRDVRVRAIQPMAIHLSPKQYVVDWGFEEDHPLLWDFAERSTIYVNGPFDRRALIDGLLALELPHVSERDLLNHIELPPGANTPLGMSVPARLHESVLTVFQDLEVPVYSPGSPSVPRAVVFLIDDGDYIVAGDFEVDVPVFVHQPEWFQAPASGDAG